MKRHLTPLGVPLAAHDEWCAVFETRLAEGKVPVYLLDQPALFARDYVYAGPGGVAPPDNLTRFAFLSRGALELCRYLGWQPDVLHAHDWPTALAPVYLNAFESLEKPSAFAPTASVLTIHNLAHQGVFPSADLESTGLAPDGPHIIDLLEGKPATVNLLKGGLSHATKLTTVSPRYAEEICTPELGCGLESIVQSRVADLVGILNGIDERAWDPANDPAIAAPFSAADLSGKAACKRALQREMRLAPRDEVPLLAMVTRLASQKGIDVVANALDRILALDTQVVLLGAGDPELEEFFRVRSLLGGRRFRATLGYDEGLAHRIEAGADLFLMPSRFEPCGLNQMYSQRYGTLPVVRATGGLDDTVEQCDEAGGKGTGFKLWDLSPESLVDTVGWAVSVYRTRPALFREMQERAMKKHFGWDEAAAKYTEVYGAAMDKRRAERGSKSGSGGTGSGRGRQTINR
jgi:starch synthase